MPSHHRGSDADGCLDRQSEHGQIDALRRAGGNPPARRQLSGRDGRKEDRADGACRAGGSKWSICRDSIAWRPDRATKWWPSRCSCSGSPTSGPVDVVLCIVDGSNLERHFYLVSQVLELGLPTVAGGEHARRGRQPGIKLELRHLQTRLGIAVVPIQANRGQGLGELKAALIEAVGGTWCSGGTRYSGSRSAGPSSSLFPGGVRKRSARACRLLLATQGCHAAACGCGRPDVPHRLMAASRFRWPKGLRGRCCRRHWCGDCSWIPADISRIRFYRMPTSSSSAPAVGPGTRRGRGLPDSGRGNDGPLRLGPLDASGRGFQPKTFPVTATDRIDRVLTHRFGG